MAQYVYSMHHLNKIVPPKRVILKDISLSFFPGAKIGVLGLNGAGKSSLLKIMAGVDKEYDGEARAMPGINVGYLPQEPQLDPEKTVYETIEEGVAPIKALLKEFDDIIARFSEGPDGDEMERLLERQSTLQNAIDACEGWELDRTLQLAAQSLNLPPMDAIVKNLSGGEKRRVALCRLVLSKPEMLLLDEPTNHLDAESVSWLEQFLKNFQGTVVAVTHDRYFLDNVAGWILELDRGEGHPFKGNYTTWLEQKQQRLAVEEKQETARQKTMERELEWVRANPKARQSKSKARLQAFEELCSKETQKRNETLEIYIPAGPRLGDKVIDIHHLSKRFGDKIIFSDLNLSIPRGAIVGIIGANGAGKSTFFRMLSGQEQPDSGEIVFGDTVQLAFVDQSRDSLDGTKNVWQEISDGQETITIGQYSIPSRAYIGRFNFKGADQQKWVKDLSGGERNRLHLAKLLKSGGNVLLLDEPTNDLDVETLRALEEAILNFAGSVMVTSHDRWFLDRIATHILAFHGNGKVTWFDGNFTEYDAYYHKKGS